MTQAILNEDLDIKRDIMRFKKNSQSSNLVLLAIVFNVVYFISLYQSDVGTWYYNILMGASILYNLVFMLAAFLSSEGVKNYKKGYSLLLLLLAAIQIARIFIIPTRAWNATVSISGIATPVMGIGQFILLVVCLVASAICLALSAVVNFSKCAALEQHMKALARKAA